MERATYEIEARVERSHWWFRGRRRILARLLADLPPWRRALDVGCGTGANAPVLAGPGRFAIGLEASPIPLGLASRGHDVRVRADAGRLPFADASFDLVLALDVLEHLDDDAGAARELARVVRPGGTIVVFVPALRILWGLQDDVSHHRRRYRAGELRRVLEQTGLMIIRTTYFNTLLFAPILLSRIAMRIKPPRRLASENQIGGPVMNEMLAAIFAAEAPIIGRYDLPIGVSLACLARKEG